MNLKEMIANRLPKGVASTQVYTSDNKRIYISWFAQVMAWRNYAMLFGDSQSAQRISDRGGFGEEELDAFYPEWRNHILNSQNQ